MPALDAAVGGNIFKQFVLEDDEEHLSTFAGVRQGESLRESKWRNSIRGECDRGSADETARTFQALDRARVGIGAAVRMCYDERQRDHVIYAQAKAHACNPEIRTLTEYRDSSYRKVYQRK